MLSDAEFLASYDASIYERPSVAVDVVVLTAFDGVLRALALERTQPPQAGRYVLPGGFVGIDEELDAAAQRVLQRDTGLSGLYLEQLYTFGAPLRDPRTRVISVAYIALVDAARLGDLPMRRVRVDWEGETGGAAELLDSAGCELEMAFDHAGIVGMAVKRLRGKLGYTAIGYQLLPERFTLRQLQDVHETVLGRSLNKDSFRRRVLASGDLEATGELEADVEHRPAELFRFTHRSAL